MLCYLLLKVLEPFFGTGWQAARRLKASFTRQHNENQDANFNKIDKNTEKAEVWLIAIIFFLYIGQ